MPDQQCGPWQGHPLVLERGGGGRWGEEREREREREEERGKGGSEGREGRERGKGEKTMREEGEDKSTLYIL